MVRFNSIYGERNLVAQVAQISGGVAPVRGNAGRADPLLPWSPPSLVDEYAIRNVRNGAELDTLLSRISARSMRLKLYSGLAESGSRALDSLSASVEWANAVLIYSGMSFLKFMGEARGMKVYGGYDPKLVEYGRSIFKGSSDVDLFRIYARTAQTTKDIVSSAEVMASHRGYISETETGLEHFEDITGVFITRPDVATKRVGISGYEHFVDFRLSPVVPMLKIKGQPEYLIPGPPRLSREEMDQARAVIAGERAADQSPADAVELMRLFPEGVPKFSIPIKVAGHGKLSELFSAGSGFAPSMNATGSALMAAGLTRQAIRPYTSMLPMVVPTIRVG